MAEQEPHSLASTFPNPPPFWKDFTPDRVARIDELRSAFAGGASEQASSPAVRIPGLPGELANLQPPPEPSDGRWRVFGAQYTLNDKLPTLEEQGIANLPTTALSDSKDAKHYDRAFQLKKLSKSLLLNFLELAGTLSRDPAHAQGKIQDLRTLFVNIHHILNEYRPHQARESAIAMMQDHLDRTRSETEAITSQVDKARSILQGLANLGHADPRLAVAGEDAAAEAGSEGDKTPTKRETDLWAATDALLGL
ncbi:Mediator complex, subunit Med7 [Metarhizium album ARSEF 1941]|uniref:Mediator of RNA polymerase II transcription subunit 7 n=1 Tax=Metarhizium album (strain ARSEF 1941) TaxID=1081103 RepID=A0A0B2WQW8_METAS|nr:Mediator complex, subunit Med7 [Metarhizium album ARSEF 1941]KHN95887.1 Mediator complex, subunit Med7 [Metarhizium album ARSEF 1941]